MGGREAAEGIRRRPLLVSLFIIAGLLSGCSKPPNEKYNGSCKLTIADSPEVRGLKLGMSIDQVKAKFPALNIIPPADERGHTYIAIVSISPRVIRNLESGSIVSETRGYMFVDRKGSTLSFDSATAPDLKMDLSGIDEINLKFLEDRISEIRFKYKNDPNLNSLTGFTCRLSQVFHIPFYTSTIAEDVGLVDAECYDFRATAQFGGVVPDAPPILTLEDVLAREKYVARLRANPEEGSILWNEAEQRKQKERERLESEKRQQGFKP